MINPKELRYGNWLINHILTDLGGENTYVPVNNLTQIWELNSASWRNLSPVPLNPDLLKKCGFEIVNPGGDQQGYLHPDLFLILYVYGSSFTATTEEGLDITSQGHLKYLHQLQNFFYFLTGKELEIKL